MARGIWTGGYTITGKKSFTGQETFGLHRFGGDADMFRLSMRFVSHFDRMTTAVTDRERKILFWLGSWTKRRMEWKLSKHHPKKWTPKTHRMTKRWQREVIGQAERPPYRVTGALRNNVRFAVDVPRLTVYTGPVKLKRPSNDTIPLGENRSIPALLDRGGPAEVWDRKITWITTQSGKKRYWIWARTGTRIVTLYRAFPYVENTRDEAWNKLQQRLRKEGLL